MNLLAINRPVIVCVLITGFVALVPSFTAAIQDQWSNASHKIGRGAEGTNTVTVLKVRQDSGDVIVGLNKGVTWESSLFARWCFQSTWEMAG